VLTNYTSQDEGLVKWRDLVRHRLHDFATKNRISDATIEEKVHALFYLSNGNYDAAGESDVLQLVKDVRDILEERGMYPVESLILGH